jgi:hypothetical protein
MEKLISMGDLFRRIPELQAVISEYLGQPPFELMISSGGLFLVFESLSVLIENEIEIKDLRGSMITEVYVLFYPLVCTRMIRKSLIYVVI